MKRRDFLLMTAALLAGCAGTSPSTAPVTGGMTFSESERRTIEAFYGAPRRDALAAPTVKPGDVLDSGQRPGKLPSDLLAKLPDLPAPYTRLVLGSDVILVNRDTHLILDVIQQVAR